MSRTSADGQSFGRPDFITNIDIINISGQKTVIRCLHGLHGCLKGKYYFVAYFILIFPLSRCQQPPNEALSCLPSNVQRSFSTILSILHSLSRLSPTMDPLPIPPSYYDLERRHLEHTIDHDLHSLSLSSLHTSASSSSSSPFHPHDYSHSFISSSSDPSLEYPRAQCSGVSAQPTQDVGHGHSYGPSGTPRAARRTNPHPDNFGGGPSTSTGISPVSTAGHHASAITLGTGAFKGRIPETNSGDHDDEGFDPERSLGRLVGELGRIIGNEVSTVSPIP